MRPELNETSMDRIAQRIKLDYDQHLVHINISPITRPFRELGVINEGLAAAHYT